jgi:NADH dehydrogenase
MTGEPKRVLILGGGFGGVYTAMHLERSLGRRGREEVEIALVNRDNYLVFQPMLPEVISGVINTLHVICPIRRLAPHARVYTREIERIDLERKTVRLAPGCRPKPLVLRYDHLVLALGTVLDDAKVPGMREHAMPFKYLGDGLVLRNHLVRMLEQADIENDADERQRLLTFVVAGGGFSGVECAAELNDFVHAAIKVYRRLRPKELRVILLQSAERILPEIDAGLAGFAHRILERRGIEIRLQTRLQAVTAEAALAGDKSGGDPCLIPTRTTVVTVPTRPHALIAGLPCELDRGKVRVDATLGVPGWDGLWAVGDCAAVPQPDGILSPPTAQHAIRQARLCARNILATFDGRTRQPFQFTGLGKLGSLGRGAAVAEILGIKLSGLPAWFLWRAIYLAKFPGLDRKLRILTDWVLDVILPRDITQIRLRDEQGVVQEHFEPGQVVFDQGDFGDKLYVVVRGDANVYDGGVLLRTLQAGDVFGEIALIADTPRTARVRAVTSLDVISVPRNAFGQLVAHLPGVRGSMDSIMRRHLEPSVESEVAGE